MLDLWPVCATVLDQLERKLKHKSVGQQDSCQMTRVQHVGALCVILTSLASRIERNN